MCIELLDHLVTGEGNYVSKPVKGKNHQLNINGTCNDLISGYRTTLRGYPQPFGYEHPLHIIR